MINMNLSIYSIQYTPCLMSIQCRIFIRYFIFFRFSSFNFGVFFSLAHFNWKRIYAAIACFAVDLLLFLEWETHSMHDVCNFFFSFIDMVAVVVAAALYNVQVTVIIALCALLMWVCKSFSLSIQWYRLCNNNLASVSSYNT